MELAIPVLALGGLYIMSNQKEEEVDTYSAETGREGFQNSDATLPNMNVPTVNYPITSLSSAGTVNEYRNSNQATDKYHDQTVYEDNLDRDGTRMDSVFSLTGEAMARENFRHNNMVPFFGAKIKGAGPSSNVHEGVLDNMQGAGSQRNEKREQAPLFAPETNVEFVAGAPNNSDFFQSRVQPSQRAANVKPWEEVHVGPGLGQGFTSAGTGGFNSGYEVRDMWQPRTVDQLRTVTNPKITYTLDNLEGALKRPVQNLGVLGKVEKYMPDTYFENSSDRWLTTTGAGGESQTAQSAQMLGDVNRTFTTRSYFGAAGDPVDGGYVDGKHTDPKRNPSCTKPLPAASAAGQFAPGKMDYGRDGFEILPNNRDTSNEGSLGIVGGMMRAALAPLMDVLRPSRKEDVVGNICPNGYVATTHVAAPVHNPADRAPTTIREMTAGLLDNNHLNMENQAGAAYTVAAQQAIRNQRDSTSVQYAGAAGGDMSRAGKASYVSAYNQHNNGNKTYANRPHQGGTAMMMSGQNLNIGKVEGDRFNTRDLVRSGGPSAVPSAQTHGYIDAQPAQGQNVHSERMHSDYIAAFKSNPYTHSLQSWA
mgnify:CR=1 FL=1